jgi:D-serine deaminase-like pyridoxal phosphate-dependent protein
VEVRVLSGAALTARSRIDEVRNRVAGRPIAELPTPALLLDRPALRRNIAMMAEWAAGRVGVRPHAKTRKCLEIALLQQEAGSLGSTAATVAEATAVVSEGVGEVLIANEVIDGEKLALRVIGW